MSDDQNQYTVGDPVVVTSVNRSHGYEGVVTKVGRKLVTVANHWGQTDVFRIDTGAKNDQYGHEHVWSMPEYAAKEAHKAAAVRVTAHGIKFDHGVGANFSTDDLCRIADLLDELAGDQP